MVRIAGREDGLFVEELGSGPPVVLLHSFLCSGEMWRFQVPALAEHYRVLNVDLPGHGRSRTVDEPVDLYDLARAIADALADLRATRAVWCGLSIGGMVALRACLVLPDRVSALALLDSHAGTEAPLRKLKYRAMGLGVRLVGIRPFVPLIARLMFGHTTRRENPALVSEWKGRFRAVHVPSALRYLDGLIARDSVEDRLAEIAQPSVVIVGEEDRSLPPPCSEEIHRGLSESRYVVIERAGHLSALERPAAVTRALLSFLDRVHGEGTGP